MDDFTNWQRRYAAFTPAIFLPYAEFVAAPNPARPLPDGLRPGDLDFIDRSNPLYFLPNVLLSAGQAIQSGKSNMVTQRDRSVTNVLGDSGGYQIITGQLKDRHGRRLSGTEACRHVLPWLEDHCDWGMTLDIPSRSVFIRDSGYWASFDRCLADTLVNLDYFR